MIPMLNTTMYPGMKVPRARTVDGLDVYVAAAMNAGINVNAADLTIGLEAINSLPLTENTYNFSAGRTTGWTSRYGIWPVPGHNSTENGTLITGGVMNGYSMRSLVAAEQSQAAHTTAGFDVYDKRKFLYGAAVVQLPVGTGGKTVPVVYWLSSRTSGTNHQIDILPSTEVIAGGQQMGIRSHLEAGIGGGTAVVSYVGGATEVNASLQAIDRLHTTNLTGLRQLPSAVTFAHYIRWTILQTNLGTNLNEFVGQQSAATPDPGGAPRDLYFNFAGSPYWNNGLSQRRNMGFSVSLSGSVGLATAPKKWTAKSYFSQTAGDLIGTAASNRSQSSTANSLGGKLAFSSVANATYVTSGGYPLLGSSYLFARVDDQSTTTPLTVIAMVTNRPLIAALNPYLRDSTESDTTSVAAAPPPGGNDFVQWIDPTNNFWAPRLYNTVIPADLATVYSETWAAGGVAIAKQTCWQNAPVFVFGTETTNLVHNAGLLKANTVYEYAYSVYNALTGKESNVGVPATAFVTTDNSAVLVHSPMNPLMYGAQTNVTQFPSMPALFSEGTSAVQTAVPINFLSYRVYYREVGSFEWLFNGEYSFAQIYFEPFAQAVYIGKTSAVGNVGGQPGGFNDYSDLPVDNYIDVVSFRGHLLWLTKQMVRYSRGDDIFSYPAANFATAPSGEFRGGIAHFFAGQSSQTGRVVVFGTDGNYEARFTGNLQQQQVRVSSTAQPVAVYVDGSDFTLTIRGSDTAFSARCAVVAEGILYFMGPTGIFRDDGVDLPKRISQAIEPLYFDAYDKTNTDRFFAYYNRRSREILFFYLPSTVNPSSNPNNYLTKAWVYSLRTESFGNMTDIVDSFGNSYGNSPGAWSQYGYNSLIDWAQDIDETNFETATHGGGVRTLIGVRADASALVSRPYYHDDDCEGGDYKPGYEMMVKEIQKPDASTLRMVLASGYSSTILNNIVAGSTSIAIGGSTTYGDMAVLANVDGFYTVKAKNVGAGTIDIAITGSLGVVGAQTFTIFQYFPIFVLGFHDMVAKLESKYLCPDGLFKWMLTRYMHVLIKPVAQHQGTAIPALLAAWQANHQNAAPASSKTLSLYPLNSRETTTQILTDIPSPGMEAQAQAVKTTLTYNQVAGRFSLYMMAHYYGDAPSDTKQYQRDYG